MKTMEQLKSQMKPNMTLDEFFQPDVLFDSVNELVNEFCCRNKPVGVVLRYDKESNWAAATSFKRIFINLASEEFQRYNTFEERYQMLVGLTAHELGHILFDDNKRRHYFYRNIRKGKLWPVNFPNFEMHSEYGAEALKTTTESLEKDLHEFKSLYWIYKNIANMFEDKYVERRMSERFPETLKPYIDFVRSDWNKTMTQSAQEMILYNLLNGLFAYIFDISWQIHPVVQDYFNAAVEEYKYYGLPDDDMQRNKLYTAVTVCVYPFFKVFMEVCKEKMEEDKNRKENDNVSSVSKAS